EQERRNVGRWSLARKNRGFLDAAVASEFLRSGNLIGFAAGENEAGFLRHARLRKSPRVEQQIESLIRLEGSRVQHHRRRRREPERLTNGGGLRRRRLLLHRPWCVLDEDRTRRRLDGANRFLERRADDDDGARAADHEALEREEQRAQCVRLA